jgi:predicted PurR-regulated permease PerM
MTDDTRAEPQALPMPVDPRSAALVVLAVIAALALLHWAKLVFVPLLLAVLLSYALMPAVDRLERWHIHRALAAAVLLVTIVAGIGAGVVALQEQAQELADALPRAAQKLGRTVAAARSGSEGPLRKVEKAAETIERAVKPPPNGVPRVQVERRPVSEYLWSGTLGVVTLIGEAVVILFLTFFVLAGGNTLRRKLVTIAGPAFSRRKITLQMIDEIGTQIQRYLLINLFNSVLIGVATWLAFKWLGLESAAVWGVIAAVTNWVPYLGPTAVTFAAAVAAFLQFDSLEKVLAVLAVSTVLQILEGNLLLPWMMARVNRMSPVVVFVTVLVFGFLWGGWGLLLGVPVMVIVKAVCDRVDEMKPFGQLLGD